MSSPRTRNHLHRDSREFRAARALMFDVFGRDCWICGHPGANDADHLDSIASDPDQPVDYSRMRPAHGALSPCTHPDCVRRKGKPRSCNQERGDASVISDVLESYDW